MSIEEIASTLQGDLTTGHPVSLSEYSIDSRSIIYPEHTLFFALTGKNHDAHDYIASLYRNGVRAFVIRDFRPEYETFKEANFIRVHDVQAALQQLAAYHRTQLSTEIIAITGSNGKTIVKEWIHQLLSPILDVYRSPRSYNSQVGVPLSLLGIPPQAEIALIEAGISQVGEMQKLHDMIRPDIGIFTHLGTAHDEHFSSQTEKLAEKARLFATCRIIIGEAGEPLDFIRTRLPESTRLFTWSDTSNPSAQVHVFTRHLSPKDREINIHYGKHHFSLTLPFPDKASFENAMNAICLLLYKNIAAQHIQQQIVRLSPIAMRMEIKEGIHDCLLINDYYNSDPTSLRIALHTLSMQDCHKERVVILSDFIDAGKDHASLYRETATLLRQSRVTRFIGIGPELEHYRSYFDENARFYKDTDHFLHQEEHEHFHNQVILIKGARPFRFEFIANFLQKQSHGTVLEVDLDAMTHNLNYFRSLTPARIAVMVKARSYGSGTKEVAALLQYHRVDYLMVAFADEGIELRAANISTPIAVMNPEPEAFDSMILFNLEPEIYAIKQLEAFESALSKHGVKRFPIHVKLNTGMNRSGLDAQDLPALFDFFSTPRTVYIKTVFSHLAGSDDPLLDPFTLEQVQQFERLTATIQSHFPHKIWRHLLNSAGIERFPAHHYEMVRLGIGLHGISAIHAPLQPVSSFKTRISSLREIPANSPVGYGCRGLTTRFSRIAVIPVGYADGLNRHLSNGVGEVYLNGHYAPIIGNICMDTCMIDVTDIPAQAGDEVEIFGSHIPVSEVASRLATIPYEILTTVSPRVKRIYYKE